MDWPPPAGGTWVIDLDGVLWLTGEPIPGAGEALSRLQASGVRLLFATNNSSPTHDELQERLRRCGIARGDVVTSAHAVASLVDPGERVMVLGDAGVVEALQAVGAVVTDAGPADAVVVGWTRDFDFAGLAAAADAVRAGARLLGTNEDATHPTPSGSLPGGGALLAAVAVASETTPVVAGKPHLPMAELLASRADDIVATVGDRPATDGLLARQLGVPFALVRSGVTPPGAPAGEPRPAADARDLGTLVAQFLS
jgi:HAD superfamily hydrolase (TIGR01450 family)